MVLFQWTKFISFQIDDILTGVLISTQNSDMVGTWETFSAVSSIQIKTQTTRSQARELGTHHGPFFGAQESLPQLKDEKDYFDR